MIEVNIVHPSLNVHGGAELICLEMIKVYKENNYIVNLYTLDKIDLKHLSRSYGEYIEPDSCFHFIDKQISHKASIIKLFYLTYLYIKLLLLSKKNYNAVSINNFGDVLPIIADFSYIHSVPLFTLHKNKRQNPYQIKHWSITSKLYYMTFCLVKSILKLSNIITNSQYNSQIIKKSISKNSLIIYPPIKKLTGEVYCEDKKQIIITVSRISKMKNLHIIPHIASLVQEKSNFTILGGTHAYSVDVLNDISKLVAKYDVSNKINVIKNPRRSMIEEAYSTASIYLSTQPTEAFGMAIIEAIIRDCVPLVPRMGGPWIDILEEKQGWYGFGYVSVLQAALFIQLLLSNEEMRKRISKRAKYKAKEYDSTIFQKKMMKILRFYDQ